MHPNDHDKRKEWVAKVKKAHKDLKDKCERGEPITPQDCEDIIIVFGGGGPGSDDGP